MDETEDKNSEQENSINDKISKVEEKQRLSDNYLKTIIKGVDLLTVEVTTLNDRVYTTNYLDKIRNRLIGGVILTFVLVSFLFGFLIYSISSSNADREKEASQSRRQIADCTVKPGVELEKNYINPGTCYKEGADRTKEAVDKISSNIVEQLRSLLNV